MEDDDNDNIADHGGNSFIAAQVGDKAPHDHKTAGPLVTDDVSHYGVASMSSNFVETKHTSLSLPGCCKLGQGSQTIEL